jgi:thymidine kinase
MNSIKSINTTTVVPSAMASASSNSAMSVSVSGSGEGYLELILGPMFSGKTSTLKKIYDQCMYCNIPVTVINYSGDTRYSADAVMSTHDKIMIPCIMGSSIIETIKNNAEKVKQSEVILINEGQFFADIKCIVDLVEKEHKRVYICGLDGDFQKNKIGSLLDLIPHCDNVCKLKSLCSSCRNGKAGLFSYRITNETDQVVIGVENYKPLCRSCYENMSSSKQKSVDV